MRRPWSAVGAVAVHVLENRSSSVANRADTLSVSRPFVAVVGSVWFSTVTAIAFSTTPAVSAIFLFRHDMPFLH